MIRDDEKEFRHESYGLVGFSRINGGTGRLFGSALPDQATSILLRVTPACRLHHLSRDWYHHDNAVNEGRDYIELELSSAQFAEMLTSMNMGDGVPCTIRRLNGRRLENPPNELLEAEQVREGFKGSTDKLVALMKGFSKTLKDLFENKRPITQKTKEEVTMAYRMVVQQVEANLPFVIDQFHTASAKIITQAKAEVDAFMTHAVMSAGLRALAKGEVDVTPRLSTGEEKKP